MSNEIKAQASIEIVDGALTTTSLDVARHFEKQHRNVLQAIENLLPKLTDSYKLNFQLIQIEVDLGPPGGVTSDVTPSEGVYAVHIPASPISTGLSTE